MPSADPPPPPLPPPPAPPLPTRDNSNILGKPSKFCIKLKTAPEGWAYHDNPDAPPAPDPNLPDIGPYFVYGTLMDSDLLKDILELDQTPRLRPAKVIGYRRRSWGQYPALVDGACGEEVQGMVYDVKTYAHARRLAEYETAHYHLLPVQIEYVDGLGTQIDHGWTFMFAGAEAALSDAEFDLAEWLKRMGRSRAVQGACT